MAKDIELEEELDLEAPRTIRDVVIQTHTIVQQILGRLDKMDGRMDRMDGRMDRMDSRMDRMDERAEKRFLWTIGIILTTWMTLMVTILVKM